MIASAMATFPPRLHVLLARNADTGVIFRRGPSKSVCAIAWDRKRDKFSVGQWLRGRIYERRADLSPDGRYLIYFAMNGRWSSSTKGSWTAISRAPYLKAIVLLGKGDCWHGGGLFVAKNRYWLNNGYGHFVMRDSAEVKRDEAYRPAAYYGGECPSVYYLRLQRDGWEIKPELSNRHCDVFEKDLPAGWRLRKLAHMQTGAPPGKGCYWDEHQLEHTSSGQRIDGASWEWADLDSRRLIYADGGKLYAADILKRGEFVPKLLEDFSDWKFEAIAAPY
jgi:hypothetical protein